MTRLFSAFLFLIALAGCAQTGTGDATTASNDSAATASETAASETTASAAPAPAEKPASYYENKIAEVHTTAGQINLRFFPDVAPNHVKNFIDLAEAGFYNETKFHRIVPGFMIQGGDPNTKGGGDPSTWGTGGSEKNVRAEFNNKTHKRGILSMARSQHPDSASSQFFIVVADSSFLDNEYTVFGEVTQGMDVADKIVGAPRTGERPIEPVTITRVVVRDTRAGEIAK